tara:strand:- start:1486 stop:2979 length:1494 start_codon:yes stop_codon:yes gene_type:complete
MGIVQKQGFKIAGITYLGIIVGAINTMFVYPRVFGAEKHGLILLLLSLATLITQFAHLGIPNVIIQFFPLLKNRKHFIYRIITQLPILAFIVLSLLFQFFGDSLFSTYNIKNELFEQYQVFVLPLVVMFVIFEVFCGLARAELKTVVPAFLKEFLIRVLTLILLISYSLELISFHEFMIYWLACYVLNAFLLSMYLVYNKLFKLSFGFEFAPNRDLKFKMINYGLVTLFTLSATILVNRIDLLMLAYFHELKDVAFYSVALYMSTLIQIPARSIIQIGKPLLAKAWNSEDLIEIQNLYSKSALNQMIFGSAVFVGIWLSIDDILLLIPVRYQGIKFVFLFLALSKLVDTSCGLNGGVIVTSKKYKFDLYINLILIVLTFVTNLLFIPNYGIEGAAFATSLSIICYNIIKWFLLKKWFGLNPFDINYLKALLTSLIVLVLVSFFPSLSVSPSLSILFRSLLVFILFLFLHYKFNLSPDVHNLIRTYKSQLTNKFFKNP